MRNFGNHEINRAYERSHPSEKAAPAPQAETQDGHDEQPIEDSVAEHGPVEHIEMHSHHKDGHVHKSKHHDAMGAHDHVDKAMPAEQKPESEYDEGGMSHKGMEAIPSAQ